MGTAPCTLVQKTYYNGGWTAWNQASGYAGGNYPYVLQFETGSFPGASASITFALALVAPEINPKFRWGLATSDGYKDNYVGGGEAPSDPARFASGVWEVYDLTNGLTNATRYLTINTSGLKPNTTYYLYLWNYNGSSCTVWGLGSCSASLDYVLTYNLSITAETGSTITVNRTSSPVGLTGAISDGATIYAGDVLTITFEADSGYEIVTHTVNGASFASGGTHTVEADVVIVITANRLGLIYIDNGTKVEAYMIYIDNGSSWDQYIPYVDNGSGWDLCG